jgi:hypothetical protein
MGENDQREALQSRIVEGLASCDEDTLLRIGEMLRPAEAAAEEPVRLGGGITRRQFLVGAAAGGAGLVSTNIATGLVAGSLGARVGEAKAELEAQTELIKLRGLLALYENLEQVGIDALLSTGIAALTISLEGLELGISGLQSGVRLVDRGVSAFENAFPTIRSGLSLVENLVTSVENRVTQVQELMSEVQDVVSPLTDALGSFFSSLVERIPGVGPTIVDALDRISELVGSLPQIISQIRRGLLEPLREHWFTDDEETGLKGRLLNPLQENLLEPLEDFLGDVADAIDEWQKELINPVEEEIT